jgi:dTDP-4-amino-4,6-dideoxygalactose transaminase
LPPLYHHPNFAALTVVSREGKALLGNASLPEKQKFMVESEALLRDVFGIPFHPFMDEEDMEYVVKALCDVLDEPRATMAQAH